MIQINAADFDQAVAEALNSIPAHLQPYLENVLIEVRRRPDARLADEQDIPPDTLGLYMGCPLTEKSVADQSVGPDRILIFRDALTAMCASRDELVDEIRITVLHEVGHHFGLDEERLEELGYD